MVLLEVGLESAIKVLEVDGDRLEDHRELEVVPFVIVHIAVDVRLQQLTLFDQASIVHFDAPMDQQEVLHHALRDLPHVVDFAQVAFEGVL